jgi:hypothetical protein
MVRGHKVDSEKRRPGRKGNFQGKRLELLESFLPDWDRARQNKTTGDFWTTVIPAYWAKFPWHLQQDEEPSGDTDLPADENLTAEEVERKAATIRLVDKVRFSSFFVY